MQTTKPDYVTDWIKFDLRRHFAEKLLKKGKSNRKMFKRYLIDFRQIRLSVTVW